jgi:hypothetical protein
MAGIIDKDQIDRREMLDDWMGMLEEMLGELERNPTSLSTPDYERLWDGMMNLMAILQDIETH